MMSQKHTLSVINNVDAGRYFDNSAVFIRRLSDAQKITSSNTGIPRPSSQRQPTFLVTCISASIAIVSAIALSNSTSRAENKKKEGINDKKLEVYLMDRIAKKPYLNYHSIPSEYSASLQSRRFNRDRLKEERSTRAKSYGINVSETERPKGVPSRLRLLTIDVPKFKEEAFDNGICVMPSDIFDTKGPKYVDGVAPPKRPEKSYNQSKKRPKASNKPIIQKSLARELYYCFDPRLNPKKHQEQQQLQKKLSKSHQPESLSMEQQLSSQQELHWHPKIGVEILEASIMRLNRNNIRRTYTTHNHSGWKKKSYRYDPGKYAGGNTDTNPSQSDDDESGFADADEAEFGQELQEKQSIKKSTGSKIGEEDIDMEEHYDVVDDKGVGNQDERNAPWNQYAWLEEMHLRVRVIIHFLLDTIFFTASHLLNLFYDNF